MRLNKFMKTTMTETELALNGLPTNLHNPYQGKAKRVLCVCSGGILRSATAAEILSREPYNYNTRAAGIDADYALVAVDRKLVEWSEVIVCMEVKHAMKLLRMFPGVRPVHCLGIPDNFKFRDPTLVRLIEAGVKKLFA